MTSTPVSRRIVISTRLVDSDEEAFALTRGITLAACPVWRYEWISPPRSLCEAIVSEPLSDAWVFTSWRGAEGWWRIHGEKEAGLFSSEEPYKKETLKQQGANRQRMLPDGASRKNRPERIPLLYAIGDKTEKVLKKRFPSAVIRKPAEENGYALGEFLASDGIRRAIHFCGRQRRPELREVTRKAGIELLEAEMYQRYKVTSPKTLPDAFEAILFYSPDGVTGFRRLYGMPPGAWKAIAIGPATAERVRKETGKAPLLPRSPLFQEMINLIPPKEKH